MPDRWQSILEKFRVPLITDGDAIRSKLYDLGREGIDIASGGETYDLEAIGKTANDVEDIDTN
jgi:hypothetical protein